MGNPVTGLSEGDIDTYEFIYERFTNVARMKREEPKIMEFGSVTVLGATVTHYQIVNGKGEARVIGAGGGVVEDDRTPEFEKVLDPAADLRLPPKGTSRRKERGIVDAQN